MLKASVKEASVVIILGFFATLSHLAPATVRDFEIRRQIYFKVSEIGDLEIKKWGIGWLQKDVYRGKLTME